MDSEKKPLESRSLFTKDAGKAFDDFCKQYFNSSNGIFMNLEEKTIKTSLTSKENYSSQAHSNYMKVSSSTVRINTNGKVLTPLNLNTISAGCLDDLMACVNSRTHTTHHAYTKNPLLKSSDKLKQTFLDTKNQKPDPPPRPSQGPAPPPPPPTYLKDTKNSKYYFYNNTNDIFIKKRREDYNLDQEQIAFEIPKKSRFQDEFYSKSRQSIGRMSAIFFNENEPKQNVLKGEQIQPYVVNCDPSEPKVKLGLHVVTCGMNKKARLPIPRSNFILDRGNFGDDAGFVAENMFGDAFGIADGATGNCMLGYDPGDFSRNLMQTCSEIFSEEDKLFDAKSLILKSYEKIQDKTCYGSCTACVMTLNRTDNVLTAANVGDTGYCIIRNGNIIYQSSPQRITYECPRQLDSYPWKQSSRKMGISYTDIIGNETQLEKFQVKKDDLIILSSDGLFDNLEHYEIKEICLKSKSLMDAAENLVYRSVKYYRKPDDILVLIGKVVENKSLSYQNKYTKEINSIDK